MALTGLLRSWPLGGTVHESGRQVRPYRLRAFQPIETGGQFGGEVTGGRGPGCVHSPRRVLPARRRRARYRRLRPDGGPRTRGGPAPPALTSARQGDGGGRPRERPVPARYPSRTPRPTGLRCGRPPAAASLSAAIGACPTAYWWASTGALSLVCRRGSQASTRTQVRPARRNRVPSRPWPQCMTTRPGTRTRSWLMATHTSPTSSARVTVVLRL